jgi:hypothetical protein
VDHHSPRERRDADRGQRLIGQTLTRFSSRWMLF